MGFFDILKNLFSSRSYSVKATATMVRQKEIPPYQGDYAKTVFLNRYSKSSEVKDNSAYPQYFLYEFGIRDCKEFHTSLVEEGLLSIAPVSEQLKSLKVDELKIILQAIPENASGKKDVLLSRIAAHANHPAVQARISASCYSISEKGSEFLQQNSDYLLLYKHKSWGISKSEFEHCSHGKNTFYDTVWGILNAKLNKAFQKGENGIVYYQIMAELLEEEKKYSRALSVMIRVAHLHLCDISYLQVAIMEYKEHDLSIFRNPDTRQTMEKYWRERMAFRSAIPPKLVQKIREYKEYYSEDMCNEVCCGSHPDSFCTSLQFKQIIRSILDDTYSAPLVEFMLMPQYNAYLKKNGVNL